MIEDPKPQPENPSTVPSVYEPQAQTDFEYRQAAAQIAATLLSGSDFKTRVFFDAAAFIERYLRGEDITSLIRKLEQ